MDHRRLARLVSQCTRLSESHTVNVVSPVINNSDCCFGGKKRRIEVRFQAILGAFDSFYFIKNLVEIIIIRRRRRRRGR